MVKDGLKQVRISEKDRVILAALGNADIGESDSDRMRRGLRALARENGIKVPA